MAERLILSKTPVVKPLSEWKSVAVELLGTQTRQVVGKRWHHRVIECGSTGEPLLLIHGVGGHGETFARNLHNLADNGFHVFAVDALYHGYSSKEPLVDDAKAELELQADALADLVHALGFTKVHAEGESMGGMMLMAFGLKYPELAGRMVINTGFYNIDLAKTDFRKNSGGGSTLSDLSRASVTNPTFDVVRRRMEWLVADPARMTDEMVNIRLRMYDDPEIFRTMQHVYRVDSGGWSSEPLFTEADLRAYTPETLVFWTEKNPGDTPEYGEYCADLLPNGMFYSMADAAHWPQWEKPEEHDQVLIDFILR